MTCVRVMDFLIGVAGCAAVVAAQSQAWPGEPNSFRGAKFQATESEMASVLTPEPAWILLTTKKSVRLFSIWRV